MRQTLAVQKTIVEGIPWFRICADFGFKQSEDWKLNDVCQNCDKEAVVSMPLNSGYEGVKL